MSAGLVLAGVGMTAGAADSHRRSPWDVRALAEPPRVYPASTPQAQGVRGLFYEGLPWKGKETRVFAWYGVPAGRKPNEKVPAMVLAHGGGGTAFDEWVRLWNARGYAAIAMDLEGKLPIGKFPHRPGHSWSGPKRPDAFEDIDLPIQDQWFYHAVADLILAQSLLRSFPEIDADRIGLTGISWGGVLTSTTAGIDHRFRLAIPVYGCGFLNDAPVFQSRWNAVGPSGAKKWMELWDPARYLGEARMSMLWVNGSNDRHFPLSIHARSYALAAGPKTLCVRIGMNHGHPPGWAPEEIGVFADSILRHGKPLTRIAKQGQAGGQCWVTFEASSPGQRAQLVYTDDITDWVKCRWTVTEARVNAAGDRAEAKLPERCAAFFFNLTDKRGLLVSSAAVTLEPATQSRPAHARDGVFSHYPEFTWDHVPVTAHLGKPGGPFTDEEAKFLATHFPLVTIEKTQAMATPARGERGMEQAARQIKQLNPRAKVLFYWNVFLDYPMYEAHATFAAHPQWALLDRAGKPVLVRGRVGTYDLSNSEVRSWWVDVAGTAVVQRPFDGVFIDALPKIGMAAARNRQAWGDEKHTAVEAGLQRMLTMTRERVGPGKLLIYNGLRGDTDQWADGGSRYLAQTDGAMVEHFGFYSGRDEKGRIKPQQLASDIKLIRDAGLAGKIVIVKAWPNLDGLPSSASNQERARLAREKITFPLAAFLVAAEKYAYFAYSWGYHEAEGWLEWYPEFDRPLGKPLAPATREGSEYRREFEHASVWVDIQEERANITWR